MSQLSKNRKSSLESQISIISGESDDYKDKEENKEQEEEEEEDTDRAQGGTIVVETSKVATRKSTKKR